jgi:hypothetical protein
MAFIRGEEYPGRKNHITLQCNQPFQLPEIYSQQGQTAPKTRTNDNFLPTNNLNLTPNYKSAIKPRLVYCELPFVDILSACADFRLSLGKAITIDRKTMKQPVKQMRKNQAQIS